MKISRCLCDHIFRWYSDIFQHTEEASKTYTEDVEKT